MRSLVDLALLVTMPARIVCMLAIECGKSFAVMVGAAWIDPRGRFWWRRRTK